jgi:hypothetical protein
MLDDIFNWCYAKISRLLFYGDIYILQYIFDERLSLQFMHLIAPLFTNLSVSTIERCMGSPRVIIDFLLQQISA